MEPMGVGFSKQRGHIHRDGRGRFLFPVEAGVTAESRVIFREDSTRRRK